MPIQNVVVKKSVQAMAALLVCFALILQFVLIMNKVPETGLTYSAETIRYFSYMTILTNILVALVFIDELFGQPGVFFKKATVQAAVFLYIFIVGVVNHIALAGLQQLTGWQSNADTLLHYIIPVVYVSYWIFFAEKKPIPYKDIFLWVLFPLIYVIYTMIRGSFIHQYPYPFLDIDKLGLHQVLTNMLMVTAAYFVIGLLLIFLNNRMFVSKNPITL